jgi:hypothetical protein
MASQYHRAGRVYESQNLGGSQLPRGPEDGTESYFRAEQAKQAGADAVTAALLTLEGLPDS